MRWPGRSFFKLLGGTNDTEIGNVGDKLKVDASLNVNAIITLSANIFKQNEASVSSRNEFDLSGTTYTVPTGKQFVITSFNGSYDAQASLYIRVKKQTGGSGAFATILRMNMLSGGQGNSTISMALGSGILVGNATDVFKITIEASIAKGTVWAEFSGSEV